MADLILKRSNDVILDSEIDKRIRDFEVLIKAMKEEEDKLKQMLLEEMEAKGVLKIDTPNLTLTYKASYDRESFNSKAFRSDHPDMYDEYISMTSVKPSILIKVKG